MLENGLISVKDLHSGVVTVDEGLPMLEQFLIVKVRAILI